MAGLRSRATCVVHSGHSSIGGSPRVATELERLIRRLQDDGEKTAAFFASLSPQDWRQTVYTTGSKWRVREILAHFVSSEDGFHRIVRDILDGGPGAPRELKIDDYNESDVPRYAEKGAADLLERYRRLRAETHTIVAGMSPQDLDREGYHPWFGEVELRAMLKLIYRHNMIHLRDVRRALASSEPVPHLDVSPPSQGTDGAQE